VIKKIIDKNQKRERILRFAMKIFADRGFQNFKMSEISAAAKIGKGTLYEYFDNKTELISGCLDLFMMDLDKHLQKCLIKTCSPAEKIHDLVKTTFDFFYKKPERLNLLFDIWTVSYRQNQNDKEQFRGLEKFQNIKTQIASTIEEGIKIGDFKPVDSTTTASILVALIDGLLFQLAIGLIKLNNKDISDKISQTFLEGIKTQKIIPST